MVDKINVFLKTRETELLDQKLSEAQNFDLYRATVRQAFYYFHCEVSFYTYWDFHYEICCLKT